MIVATPVRKFTIAVEPSLDSGHLELAGELVPERIVTHAPDHLGVGAESRAGDGLIGSLSTGESPPRATEHGLARSGQVRCAHHEVHVERAHHADVRSVVVSHTREYRAGEPGTLGSYRL